MIPCTLATTYQQERERFEITSRERVRRALEEEKRALEERVRQLDQLDEELAKEIARRSRV